MMADEISTIEDLPRGCGGYVELMILREMYLIPGERPSDQVSISRCKH